MGNLKGKVAVISGAGSGLGKETALAYAKAGANLVICGRNYGKLEQVEDLITSQYSVSVLPIRADVSSESDVKMLIQAALAKFQRIDILINNAAVFQQYPIIDSPLDSWEYQINNNATSVFLMMREVLPIMRNQKSGHVINITTGLVREGAGSFGAYAASKAAVEALTFSIEDEEHKNGLQFHVFNPGVMKTNLATIGDDPANVAPYLVELAQTDSKGDKKVIQLRDFQLSEK
ncbi:SDR family NAD(P)-dependent oxidoreductase [Bacillus sp. 1NLA3E]|uniref:SDR family NAD(P)-dependent oxidoreductase n=1 Tax=Bacillus sp. 1NLA3E TaxID=666686 RepID=UPI000247F12C|nr:SDR family oxidoreductase [Bacillus sp. 1NLA3E]AGK55556.1 short-chain dehydrogenase/reductase SDR [Bacillus sp. 1NLA3E]